MMPEISVLIPCYNYGHYLEYALESVTSQSYQNWEAIVIDDGSTDDTPQVTTQFDDPRIRYIYQENRGLSAARNTGLRSAQADLIALLDADDIWQAEYLAKMVTKLKMHPDAVAAYCGYQYIDQDGENVGLPNLTIVPPEDFREYLANNGNFLVSCGVVFRKKIAVSEGCFDESLNAVEDADMWSKLSRHGPFVSVPSILVGYRRHDSNMSSDPQRMVAAYYQILERNHGSPKGGSSAWPEKKKHAYTRYFRSASTRYLAFGDIQRSAGYFMRLYEINPEVCKELGLWRRLARVHLPVEIRNEPNPLDWNHAERDVQGLLDELDNRSPASPILEEHLSKLAAYAYLAFADEAFRANDARRAFKWIWKASNQHLGLILTRPYWGTLARGVTGIG